MLKKLSSELEEILEKITLQEQEVTIGEVIDTLSIKGWGIIFSFLSLAGFIPTGIPLFTIPVGIIIALLSITFLFASRIYLPNMLRKKKVDKKISKAIKRILPIIKKIEYFSKSRLFSAQNIFFRYIIGLMIFVMGIFMALPIPFTQTIPAIGILLLGLGLINNDGILIIIGVTLGIIILFILGLAIFLGIEFFNPKILKW